MGLAARDLTAKQERLAEIVASGQCETVTEATKLARYEVRSSGSRALHSETVQRAIERKRAERTDTARALRISTQKRMGAAIQEENDALRLSAVAANLAKIEESGIEQDQSEGVTPEDGLRLRRALIHAVRVGFRLATEGKVPSCCADLLPVDTEQVRTGHNQSTDELLSAQVIVDMDVSTDSPE